MTTRVEEDHGEFMNMVKVQHLQKEERYALAKIHVPISYYLARISHLKYKFVAQRGVTCCYSPLRCQSRFHSVQAICSHHHSRADLPRFISIFLLRGHSPVENNIPVEGFINPCYTNPFGWCPTMQPSAPKTSLSLFSVCFSLGLFLRRVPSSRNATKV